MRKLPLKKFRKKLKKVLTNVSHCDIIIKRSRENAEKQSSIEKMDLEN